MQKKGFIFDLDGVIVDTAGFHYLAWKTLANDLGFELGKRWRLQWASVRPQLLGHHQWRQ